MGLIESKNITEPYVKNYVNDKFKNFVNDNIFDIFDYMTSDMNLAQLNVLKEVQNYDWVENYLSEKANKNRKIIDEIIKRKIDKESRKSRKSRKSN